MQTSTKVHLQSHHPEPPRVFAVTLSAKVSPKLATLHVVHYVTEVVFPTSYCNTLCA